MDAMYLLLYDTLRDKIDFILLIKEKDRLYF